MTGAALSATPDPPAPTPGSGPRAPGTAELVAAAASAGAGLVHAAAAGSHSGDTTLMWLFACTAAAQLGWAAWAVLRPGRTALGVGAALNGAAVLAWVGSRTIGLVGPLDGVEPVGTQDLLAAALGAVAAGAALVALRAPRESAAGRPAGSVALGVTAVAVLLLAVPAMAAEHTHGDSHDHDHGHSNAAAAPASHGHSDGSAHGHSDGSAHGHSVGSAQGHSTDADPAAAQGPVVSLDDPRLTKQQRQAASALLTSSRDALAAFPDEAAVVAAGYRSIGDGRAVGGFEHFVHPVYLADGRELDPTAIESIVLQRQLDGTKRVMSAMYILERGKTMADVPEIAGELTTWHDHQNLCWDANGRLAGVLRDGVCVPGGTFRATPPMLHVWVDDPACGPFTGIEGHGTTSCEHTHGA